MAYLEEWVGTLFIILRFTIERATLFWLDVDVIADKNSVGCVVDRLGSEITKQFRVTN